MGVYISFGFSMAIALFLVLFVPITLYKNHKKLKNYNEPEEDIAFNEPDEDIALEEIKGQIVEMRCGTVPGRKVSEAYYFIVFRDDYGNETEYKVIEEVYLELKENVHGTLALCNGNFYGFCSDEDAGTE